MKNILIIDTSKPGIGLSITDDNSNILCQHFDSEKQSLDLPTAVLDFMKQSGNIKFDELSAIGVVVGPGSFTGIRLGIAYAKGLSIGLNIPVIPINAFEIYMYKNPDAFVAIDTGRGDCFVSAHDISPCTMTIDEIETKQMEYPKTIGHKPYDLNDAAHIVIDKFNKNNNQPVVPMYLRPSYAELNCKC